MEQRGKARISDETFDDFLASENILAVCEEDAIKEIIADQSRGDQGAAPSQDHDVCSGADLAKSAWPVA